MNKKKNLDPQHIEYVSTMQPNRICCMKNATTLFFFVNDSFLIFLSVFFFLVESRVSWALIQTNPFTHRVASAPKGYSSLCLFVIFGYNGLYLLQYFVWAHKCNFYKKKKKKKKLGNEFLVFGFVEEPSLFMEETSLK